MPENDQPCYTRWHNLQQPVRPDDLIQEGMALSVLEPGKLPAKFVLLLFDGNALRGPLRFHSQREADVYLTMQPGVVGFLIVPAYDA